MAQTLHKYYYKEVDNNTEDSDEYVIPNGDTWEVTFWNGSANAYRETHVCIIWDYAGAEEEIIAITYNSEKRYINRAFIGDGSKKLAIVLVNDSPNSERLGAELEYKDIS